MNRLDGFRRLWRLLLGRTWLQAILLGLVATGLAAALWSAAPASLAALDWSPYDAWLRSRTAAEATSTLVLIRRDPDSDARFGTGPWDRGHLARLVTALHESDASIIGIYLAGREPSPPGLGGAASDALLSEATKSAGNVIYPLSPSTTADGGESLSDPLAESALAVGQTLLTPDADHVIRSLPPYEQIGERTIPAFGLALAGAHAERHAGTTRPAQAAAQRSILLSYAGGGMPSAFQSVSFARVWDAIEGGQQGQLQTWFAGKIVLLLPEPTSGPLYPTSLGRELPASILQAHLVHTVLTGRWAQRIGPLWQMILPVLLSSSLAWTMLRRNDWRGIGTAAGLVLAYGGVVVGGLNVAGLVLPFVIPLSAAVLVLLGTTTWSHVVTGERERALEQDMMKLQQDLVAVREALVCRENAVEALEEDLDAARAAAEASAGTQAELARTAAGLRTQIEEARTQETAARQQVEQLERELQGLRSASTVVREVNDVSLERLRRECESFGIITQDHQMLGLFRDLKKGAGSTLPVLLLGEPGTGKELFARAAHRLSPRAGKPFIAVNMAAISPELFESELFGHTKGSFTGATNDRRGYFELAQGGTVFLDEIGDLRLDHQSKLLRVLQDKTFYRVGATTPTTVDVRIIAATNKDLQVGVSEGWFREDLYFRLKGLVLRLPPLRDRPLDVPVLAEHCLRDTVTHRGHGDVRLSQDALDALRAARWNGNVRELVQCLERAAILADGPLISRTDLRLAERDAASMEDWSESGGVPPDQAGDVAVLKCLRAHRFDMQATARALNWDRSTVTQRLKGLCFEALVASRGDQDRAAQALAGEPTLVRAVALKVMDYHGHLIKTIQEFTTPEEAIADCRRRFKNLPDRHFRSVERLIRAHFSRNKFPLPSPLHS